ncbi:ATP-binding cassette subfamily B protein [Rhodopseudomonas faecalis]|uniref:ATP-binding cassette subfamily B protein n=1 Tax=Rhodopseudomonas faecalis TaxID=99655 RepID=A0A318TEI1_9BRAD|nr:ABC transporter ATP-binding protein [Rhodopseudomonas faecalis]PYF02227.1 ATP-binding cassette subfamily B protein [Rhodopseudomonas faecalis]
MKLIALIGRTPRSTRVGIVVQLLLQLAAGGCAALAIATLAVPAWTDGAQSIGTGLLVILAPIAVLGLIGMRIVASAVAGRIGMPAAFAATTVLRRALLRHVVDVPLDVFSRWSSARLGMIATDQVRKVEIAFSFAVGELVSCWATTGLLLALCCALSWRIGAAALLGVGLYALTSWLSDRLIARAFAALQPATNEAARRIEEHLQGLATIRAHGALPLRESALTTVIGRLRDIMVAHSLRLSGAVRSGAATIDIAVFAGFAWAASQAESAAALTAAGCAAVLAIGANRALARSAAYLALLRLGESAAAEIGEFLAAPPLTCQPPAAIPDRFDIAFDGVTLAYDGRSNAALRGLDFKVPAGQVTAIVGPSGAGKSSILALVARHREASAGTITIGGVDIRRIPAEALAQFVTFVEQEPFLFNRPLGDNVRLGRPEARQHELDALARDVGLDEVVAGLDKGWDSIVGEAGGTLSGGERQRVAIARAALKDSPIVLLDEATSSLDADMEALVRTALARRFAGRTVLIVTHRMSIAAQADHIVVLADGRLVGAGTHEVLLAADGLYAKLCEAEQRSAGWRLGAGRAGPSSASARR